MTSDLSVQSLIQHLETVRTHLSCPELQQELRHVTDGQAVTVTAGLLAVASFLEDSVSNPYLGSLFDLATDTPLNQMRHEIADTYSVMETIPGTTGTTGLNVPAVMALAAEGQVLGVGRDAHVSVEAGIVLSGARPVYIAPPFNSDYGVLLPPSVTEVEAFLNAYPEMQALVLTLPTYTGLQGDVRGIVELCHNRGVAVMIDEAHGPHYRFAPHGFPPTAEEAQADLITQSTHKVLSALNQGSVVHFNSEPLFRRYQEMQSLGFVSTSFSYPILLSIGNAIAHAKAKGVRMWTTAARSARRLREAAARMPGALVVDESIVDGSRVVGLDPTRVTINIRGAGLNGFYVADRILASGGIVEMATPDLILFLISPNVTEERIDLTIRALGQILKEGSTTSVPSPFAPPPLPEQILTPRQATMRALRERVDILHSVGRVSAETIACYPPGQAIVVAGERITKSILDYLIRAVDAGAHLKRVCNDGFRTIQVLSY